jgi:hypothetical protein
MMKRAIGCAALVLLTGCTKYVIREKATYEAEAAFFDRVGREGGQSFDTVLSEMCVCFDGAWTTAVCKDAAEKSAILKERVTYHAAMMLYLADIVKDEPATPSAISTACEANP